MDTIIIKIYGLGKTRITNKSLFLPELTKRTYKDLSPTERSSPLSRSYLRKFRLQPNYQGEYLPRVEVFESLTDDRKNIHYILKIEFSAPKLLYWNSLQEVGENDGEKVVTALRKSLEMVGIFLEADTISNATVTAVHVCKNIPLPKTMRMREIISELAKMDITKVFDVSEKVLDLPDDNKQTKKGARVLNIHSGTIGWAFYDKVSDSMRPKNKRSDKGHINQERAVIEQYQLQDREVFRYEYRIKKTQTVKRDINAILGRVYQTQVTLKDLFTPSLIKKLVLKSWHTIRERPENQLSLFDAPNTKLGLLLHIFSEATKHDRKANSMDNAFVSYGLATAIQDHGAKELKGAVSDFWNTDHPERFKKKMEIAVELIKGLPYSNNIIFINSALERFELITLTSLRNGL